MSGQLSPIYRRILLYEPRSTGHHAGWLAIIAPILRRLCSELVLALDLSNQALERYKDHLGNQWDHLIKDPEVILHCSTGNRAPLRELARLAGLFAPDLIFLQNLNEIASTLWRKAFFAINPPLILRGRLAGIYLRPSFLIREKRTIGDLVKAVGFQRLLSGGWFIRLFLLHPGAYKRVRLQNPALPVTWLPDPYPRDFSRPQAYARRYFHLPDDVTIFTFYGGPYKRKGLDIAAAAWQRVLPSQNALLFCAGQVAEDPRLRKKLEEMQSRGTVRLLNRYVTLEEERLIFAASDVVLLPYKGHIETSGVFSRAMGVGKVVIASDEHLIGALTRRFQVGLVFPSGSVDGLYQAICTILDLSKEQLAKMKSRTSILARLWSPERFERKLVEGLTLKHSPKA